MKYQVLSFAAAVMLACTGASAGQWLKVSPGNSFADYCSSGGSKNNQHHICIAGSSSFLHRLEMNQSEFQGYLAPNGQGKHLPRQSRIKRSTDTDAVNVSFLDFVILDEGDDTILFTKDYGVALSFAEIGTPGVTDPGCVMVTISTHEQHPKAKLQQTVCRGETFTLPSWV